MKPAYKFGFQNHSIIFRIISYNAYTVNGSLTSQFGAGNILGPFQINHLAVVLKIIKLPAPVRSDNQKVNIILGDIAEFLSLIFLYNDLICKTCFPDILNPFQEAVLNIQLTAFNIITLAGDSHDQIISQLSCPLQNIIMSLMEQIKSTISNDSFHYTSCSF